MSWFFESQNGTKKVHPILLIFILVFCRFGLCTINLTTFGGNEVRRGWGEGGLVRLTL